MEKKYNEETTVYPVTNEINLIENFKKLNYERYSITEVAKQLNISISSIRKYEEDYNLIIPRDELNHRYYTEAEIQILKQIKILKDQGLNIHTIKKILGQSVDLKIQKANSLELMTLDKLTGIELKELMSKQIAKIIELREEYLTQRYEKKLEMEIEKAIYKIQEQNETNNIKLMKKLEEIRKEKNMNWIQRLFKRKNNI